MQKLVKYIALVLIITSCKTKKAVVEEQIAKETDKSSEVIQKHYEHKLMFTTASIRANASYEDAKQSLNINADLRIKKDEVIWISLKFLGITAAKAYRQALRDCTNAYIADATLLDNVDPEIFIFPTKP